MSGSGADGETDGVDTLGSQRFRRRHRLLDSRDFTRVLRRGSRRTSPELVLVTSQCPVGNRSGSRKALVGPSTSRLGITVGRKAGPSVQRNLFKRRVREWFRRHREELPDGLDIVVIARRAGIALSLAELGLRLSRLVGLESSQKDLNLLKSFRNPD